MPTTYNYGEVLQKSFLFYEAQRSGDLPPDNRILWRGDSALTDGSTVNRDLSGGYYDAGDHVKFGFPFASALTLLAWGLIEYKNGYINSNQYDEALDALKWGTDWLLKAHETDAQGTKTLWVQVGDGDADHSTWIPPEAVGTRPVFKLDRLNPGTDLAAEYSAALAAASVVFREHDPAYADRLLQNANQLYAFADDADLNPNNNGTDGSLKLRGKYSAIMPNGINYYNSYSGYPDELLWGATWMHKAQTAKMATDSNYNPSTNYLAIAEQQYNVTYFNRGWTQTWDDKSQGAGILLAQMTNNVRYRNAVEDWLNRWLPPGSPDRATDGIPYSPSGLAVLGDWGSLRLTANTAFLAGIYADTVQNQPNGAYSQFAQQQINYMLGNNPQNFSYVVGFGNNYPLQPHHRGASGINGYGPAYENPNLPNAHILYGALVGGPKSTIDSDYQDLRTDYISNEVALDYNAGFTGAVARLYQKFGGNPLRDEQLTTLNEITYNPHLQIKRAGIIQESPITTYGTVAPTGLPQLNIFLNNNAQIIDNGWKKVDLITNYNITANTILRFDFRSDSIGEIRGIGFDNDNILNNTDASKFIQLAGTQTFGNNTFKTDNAGSGWQTYSMRVSNLFTGTFRYLTLANATNSTNPIGQSEFRNITLFESPETTFGSPKEDKGKIDLAIDDQGRYVAIDPTNNSLMPITYAGNRVTPNSFAGWSIVAAERVSDSPTGEIEYMWKNNNLYWHSTNSNTGSIIQNKDLFAKEQDFEQDFNGDGNITLETNGNVDLAINQNGNYIAIDRASNTITPLTYAGSPVRPETFAGWAVIAAERVGDSQTGPIEYMWKSGNTFWYSTNNNPGGAVSGTALTAKEIDFQQDFNGDGHITVEQTADIELAIVNGNYVAIDRNGTITPILYAGNPVGPNSFNGWSIIAAERVGDVPTGIIEYLWKSNTGYFWYSNNNDTGTIVNAVDQEWRFQQDFDQDGLLTQVGTAGNDILTGNPGNDRLLGNGGNDVLIGDAGDNRLTGGTGNDTFTYNTLANQNDTIADFTPGTDKIDLRGFGLGSGNLTFSGLNNSTMTIVQGGNSVATIELQGLDLSATGATTTFINNNVILS